MTLLGSVSGCFDEIAVPECLGGAIANVPGSVK
jgi:hypothetical protein